MFKVLKPLILLFFSVLITYKHTDAQILLIKVYGGDCVKCKSSFSQLLQLKGDIPAYFVLSEEQRPNIKEFEGMWGAYGLKTIFSDKLYSLFSSPDISSLAYLNADGEKVFQVPIYELNKHIIDSIVELYKIDFKFKCAKNSRYFYDDKEKLLIRNLNAGSYKSILKGDTTFYRLDSTAQAIWRSKMEKLNPMLFETTDLLLAAMPTYKIWAKPGIMEGMSIGNNSYFFVNFHHFDRITKGEIIDFQNDDFGLNNDYAIYRVGDNGSFDIFPIITEASDSLGFVSPTFQILGDTVLVAAYTNAKLNMKFEQPKYLSKFKLQNGYFIFDKRVNIELPDLYETNNLAYDFVSLRCYDYPYHISGLVQYFVDLEKEVEYPVIKDSALNRMDYSEVKKDSLLHILNIDSLPLYNLSMAYDSITNSIYLVSLSYGHKIMRKISTTDWSVEGTTSLAERTYGSANDIYNNFVQVSLIKKIVYCADGNGFVRGYPLEIFFN